MTRKILSAGLWAADAASLPKYTGAVEDSVLLGAVKAVRSSMEVSNHRNTNIINISVTSTGAEEGQHYQRATYWRLFR